MSISLRKATVVGVGLLLPLASIFAVSHNDAFQQVNAASNISLASDIQVGDVVIFTADGLKREFTGIDEENGIGYANKYRGAAPSGQYAFVVESGAYENTYAFKNSDGLYLSTNFSFFSFIDDMIMLDPNIDSYSSFSIDFLSKGRALVSVNPFLSHKYLCYDRINGVFDYSYDEPTQDRNLLGIKIFRYERQVSNLIVEPSYYVAKKNTVITNPHKVTATVAGKRGVTYNNYFALIGRLANGEFIQREIVTFNQSVITEEDNVIRFIARDAMTLGGNSYAFYDAPITSDEEPLTSAKNYAQYFLDNVVCTGSSIASIDWSDLSNRFEILSEASKNLLINVNEESDETIKLAIERYDFIIHKYGADKYNDFMNRGVNSAYANFIVPTENNNNSLVIIIASSFVILTFCLFYFGRKKVR